MNEIIKLSLGSLLFFTLSRVGFTAPLISASNEDLTRCKIAPEYNACRMLIDHSSTIPLAYSNIRTVNQSTTNFFPLYDPKKYAFKIVAHPSGDSSAYRYPQTDGVISARFGLTRVAHNKNLGISDGDTSNEHAQANVIIQLHSLPTIDNYFQFFTYPAHFTVTK